jgi:hypothetical protein
VTVPVVLEGQRWVAAVDVAVHGLTHWDAPYTGGFSGVLPAGSVVIVLDDPPPIATAVGCRPEAYAELEALLVPASDRSEPRYDSYSLSIDLIEFGASLHPVTG